jgi:hypothetical protein
VRRRGAPLVPGTAPAPTTNGLPPPKPEVGLEPSGTDVEQLFMVLDQAPDDVVADYLKTKWGIGRCKDKEALKCITVASRYTGKFINNETIKRLKHMVAQLTKCTAPVNVGAAHAQPPPTPAVGPAGSGSAINEASDNTYKAPTPNAGGEKASKDSSPGLAPVNNANTSVSIVAGLAILLAAILVMQYTKG